MTANSSERLFRRSHAPPPILPAVPQALAHDLHAIVCFNVLEHIDDDVSTLRRLRELLAPGGALLLLVPAHPTLFGPIDTAFGHYRRYGKQELRRKLRAAGFEPGVLRHVNPVGA